MWRRILSLLVVLAVSFVSAAIAEACPTCKEALSGQAKYGNLPQAYMWSILFMMSMPFLLLGSFGAYLYVLVRNARRQGTAAARELEPAHVE